MKRALILGASGGLGSALVQSFIARGYEVVGTTRRQEAEGKDKTQNKTEPKPQDEIASGPIGSPDPTSITLDLDSAESRALFIIEARAHGPYDLCIDAIGRQLELKRFASTPLEAFAQANADTLGHIECIQAVIPMLSTGGALVLVLSEMLERNAGFAAPYVMGKHSLLGLVKALAAEFSAETLTVFGVSPGMMDTPLTEQVPRIAKEQYTKAHGRTELLSTAEAAERIAALALPPGRHAHHGGNILVT